MPNYVRTYDVCNRQVSYVHYAVRNALLGDFKNAAIAYRYIRKRGRPLLAFLAWLSSVNGSLKFVNLDTHAHCPLTPRERRQDSPNPQTVNALNVSCAPHNKGSLRLLEQFMDRCLES
jgi:hypothetical protein